MSQAPAKFKAFYERQIEFLANNDAVGLVVSVNAGKLLHPTILVYDPDVPKEEALLLNLADEPDISVTSTLRPASLPREVFEYLSPRSRVSYYAEGRKRADQAG